MPRSNVNASKRHAAAVAVLVLIPASFQSPSLFCYSVVEALALPSFRRDDRNAGRQGETHIHSSVGWTIDDAAASGLWKMRFTRDGNGSDNGRSRGNNPQRGLFNFNFNGREKSEEPKLVPFGPVPRGGSLSDVAVLPSGRRGAAASAALEQPRQPPLARVRSGVRGVRRGIVRTAVKINRLRIGARRSDAANRAVAVSLEDATKRDATAIVNTNVNDRSVVTTDRINGLSMLRVGVRINRRLRRRRVAAAAATTGAVSDSVVVAAGIESVGWLDATGDMDAWSDMETAMQSVSSAPAIEAVDRSDPLSFPIVGKLFQRSERRNGQHNVIGAAYDSAARVSAEALTSRGGSIVAGAAAGEIAIDGKVGASTTSSSSAGFGLAETETYVIETPLFPIILPKAFEPPASASSTAAATVTSLEISVALEEATSVATDVAEAKPSPQLLQAAALPLLPKTLLDSFTGREFYYPESVEALAATGMRMTLGEGHNEWVTWSGEKKTDNFLRVHGDGGKPGTSPEWYAALDASQEVLVWAGKAASKDGYGSELPFIKTTSIIRKSPKYLAELLMDSSKVKVYNKMSLGRTDEKVFQTGVDTQGGSFSDGESKVVRNLTKPPMVSSVIEFVTCMHARKLRDSDMDILSPCNNGYAEGYVVVSRAVTGGEWSPDNNNKSTNGEKLVRNEILLGVNVLRAVPGEPDKTELTAVTHVQSPMIPLMLAKGAGVKGAVDFVRDIRALP